MKFAFFLLFIPSLTLAWIDTENLSSSSIELEERVLARTIRGSFKTATSSLSLSIVRDILKDKDKRISPEFHIPDYFDTSVRFWFSIYTQYSSKQVVIHDKGELGLIYNILDFSSIHDSTINKYAKAHLQNRLVLEYLKKIKRILKQLSSKNFLELSAEEKDVVLALRQSRIKIPIDPKKKKIFFIDLASRLRTQTGQRNKVHQGIVRALPYLPFLEAKTEAFKLPKEILAVPFLESSFNVRAVSKVDAVGIWQFMGYTANLVMPPITKNLDYRNSPVISSLAALGLLRENKMILKRWDLAVTAYNSGTKNLVKARRKFKKDVSLEFVLENYDHDSIGFASKNFYAEFLALVHTLAYRDRIYPLGGHELEIASINDSKNIGVYLTKCPLKAGYFIKALKKKSPKIAIMNAHLKNLRATYPRGTIVVSDRDLSKKKYFQLSRAQLASSYPKKYIRFLKGRRCGQL